MSRQAVLKNQADNVDTVRSYLPENYSAHTWGRDVIITGDDVAGWTMEGYVVPRLNSGLYFPKITI